MKIWEVDQGLSEIESPLTFELEKKKAFENGKIISQKFFNKCINRIPSQSSSSFERLYSFLREFQKLYRNKIEVQTPLTLFFSKPSLFFEIFWPETRKAVGRQYYILQFKSPIDLELKLRYEMDAKRLFSAKNEMLYVCSLKERIPVLDVFIEGKKREIIPREMLIERILDMLLNQEDVKYLIMHLKLTASDFERVVRTTVNENKPLFVEFKENDENQEIVSLELIAMGSLIPTEDVAIPFKKRSENYIKENLLTIPIEEIAVKLSLVPKSPTTVMWLYIYAPNHYDVIPSAKARHSIHIKCEDNAPQNLNLISCCFYRADSKTSLSPLPFDFKIAIPKQAKMWLAGLDKLLLAFMLIWAFSCVAYLNYLYGIPFLQWFEPFETVTKVNGFLEVTFTIVTLIFVAREWFFHEITAYRLCSRRFLWLLLLITLFSLVSAFLGSYLT